MTALMLGLALGAPADTASDALLDALAAEAAQVKQSLAAVPETPLYYLSYRVRDGVDTNLGASFGAMLAQVPDRLDNGRTRQLDVSVRVGSPTLDNTHKIRDEGFDPSAFMEMHGESQRLPLEDDPGALRLGLWRATDKAYKRAAKRLIQVRANKEVKVKEEDDSADFTSEPPHVSVQPATPATASPANQPMNQPANQIDAKKWAAELTRLSALFKKHSTILYSYVGLNGSNAVDYFVDTDGARLRQPWSSYRIIVYALTKADDGMDLDLYRDFAAQTPDQLPNEGDISTAIEALATQLEALRTAPVIDPYAGPAIVAGRAAAVFFHEVFGHRIEGHRQKDADEGHTFTHKVGQAVLPSFLSVVDDPTQAQAAGTWLNGHYQFDDEGVPAQPAVLIDKGVLRGFLMQRSPIKGFSKSNGHGRAQAGMAPVARQANLIVSSTAQVPFDELRRKLIAEIKRAGKPYGLIFEDISGGFTFTQAAMLPQAFKVMPLIVKRVYPDGRPDELVRGVDLIGTPLQAFEKILATGNDPAVFNGFCGAESGWVPVSAVSPSLLIGEIEVDRREPDHDRPPLLPPPLARGPGGK